MIGDGPSYGAEMAKRRPLLVSFSFFSPTPPLFAQPRFHLAAPEIETGGAIAKEPSAYQHPSLPPADVLRARVGVLLAPIGRRSVDWIGMDSTTTTTTPKPLCAQEALALLNCAAESSYDRDKCLALLDALRACIAQKMFSH
ncbi:hypothetical protein GUJ93_ZPchr0008g12195 [Zizania palustris]|uniref:CHCH domain-containing protein n=1 Tax=Zizania palustris TaxID=103762 RepID=A0A8J5RUS2_ZIZPA|nr:hypothetical protein GUJ93_ZPchr0008g12195 [Zizania palustris]